MNLSKLEIVFVCFFRSPIQNGLYQLLDGDDLKYIFSGLHENQEIISHVPKSEVGIIRGEKFNQFSDKDKYNKLLVKLDNPDAPYSMNDWQVVCTKRYANHDI